MGRELPLLEVLLQLWFSSGVGYASGARASAARGLRLVRMASGGANFGSPEIFLQRSVGGDDVELAAVLEASMADVTHHVELAAAVMEGTC